MARLIGILAVALMCAACGAIQPAASSGRSPTATATSTASPSATPTPTPSPSSTSVPDCAPPWRVCTASSAIGNFEGNGQKETFSATPIRAASGAIADWRLAVSLADGRSVSAPLSGLVAASGDCPALDGPYAKVLGAGNFAGPSRDLALVEIKHGASTRFAILVSLEGSTIQLAMVADGANRCQRVFPFSGSVVHGNGLTCGWRDSTQVLWVSQVDTKDYVHYDWYRATYTWTGLQLYLASLEHSVIMHDDPRFGPSYAVLCSSINIPQ